MFYFELTPDNPFRLKATLHAQTATQGLPSTILRLSFDSLEFRVSIQNAPKTAIIFPLEPYAWETLSRTKMFCHE